MVYKFVLILTSCIWIFRGRNSLETISLLLAYKVRFPEAFFLLRGNHECSPINLAYGFYSECCFRYKSMGSMLYDTFQVMHFYD